MSEQIVYLCGCSKSRVMGKTKAWPSSCDGKTCDVCNQPVRAVNITRLEAVAEAAREYRDATITVDEAHIATNDMVEWEADSAMRLDDALDAAEGGE